jgi:hypothetical protein
MLSTRHTSTTLQIRAVTIAHVSTPCQLEVRTCNHTTNINGIIVRAITIAHVSTPCQLEVCNHTTSINGIIGQ